MAQSKTIPLTNVSLPQIDEILRKLQLVAPHQYDVDGRIELLRTSVVFVNGLGDYDNSDIFVIYKRGNFVDFCTEDGSFDGLFAKSDSGKVLYPCQVCAKEVTNETDNTGLGIECDGCGMFFHNNCSRKPLTKDQFDAISDSPSYVKVLCPPCNRVYGSAELKLKQIEKKVTSTSIKMSILTDQVEELAKKPSYSSIMASKPVGKDKQAASFPKELVQSLTTMTKATRENENADKLKRTRVVIRPNDTKIRTSRDIRREFNKHHKGLIIKHCRLTASGSLTFEFEDEETAKKVQSQWSLQYFGGNKGMKIPGDYNTTGMIKHVYDDKTEDEMRQEILSKYEEDISGCEFLKRKDNSFMGMIKVEFKSRNSLLRVIQEKIKFCDQRYEVEEYKRKSRVIKCNKCQGWGHVHRYCGRDPKCGKCAGNHESKTCNITSGFKCAHCGEAHRAGSSDCKVYKRKEALFATTTDYE